MTNKKGLIPIHEKEIGTTQQRAVDARQLHNFLESKRDFPTWIKDRIEKYDFIENEDFSTISGKSTGGRPTKEYILTMDMAKELAMVENNEQGRRARRYFIECEKALKTKALPSPLSKEQKETQRIINEAAAIMGSNRKLGIRCGCSEATISLLRRGKFEMNSTEKIDKIETVCRHIITHGIGYDIETIDLLMGIKDDKVRTQLFNKLKKGGAL